MLPAANRMRRAAEFTDTNRRGARAGRGHVSAVVALSNPDHPSTSDPRVGLVVGRRVGGSVLRHRVSRRLRAAAAAVLAELPAGSTAILRAQPGAAMDPELIADAMTALRHATQRATRRQQD